MRIGFAADGFVDGADVGGESSRRRDTGSTVMTARLVRCAMLSGTVSWTRSIVSNNRNTRNPVNCLAIRTDIAIFATNH